MAIAAPIDGLHGQASEFLIISQRCEYSSVSTRKDWGMMVPFHHDGARFIGA